ncbi:uncharacterized protein DEA37_0012110 [Paragonimus westermani]|uniref:Uncharacterized protein n=1 Tax=Paragonimus westermani TaxID=34504 RepID=A0A5J4NBN6_9TREM|nr:uncharacterized protein DEA37_0012110 [Paragonimus westermani]
MNPATAPLSNTAYFGSCGHLDSTEPSVGVNLPKPASLVHLLRSYWSVDGEPSETGASVPRVTEVGTASESGNPFDVDLVDGNQPNSAELQARLDELALLKAQVIQLETKNTQLMMQAQHWRNQLICLEREHAEIVQKPLGPSQQPSSAQAASCNSFPRSHIPNGAGFVPLSTSTNEAFSVCTSRSVSNEFRQYMTNLLPPQLEAQCDVSECPRSFQLATSLDEFIQLVADRLQSILLLMTDECKVLCLPLLTQVICLHHDSVIRDSLLRLLFNLFAPQPPPSNTIVHNSAHLRTVAENSVSSSEHSIGRDRYHQLILNECRRLASYMGPTRLESELIPQLWSQLNERPPPPISQRLLIVSACGVISPSTPAHLQSSLMLSILESNLNEERDEVVRAASIRSLACLTCLISDWDKLPHLVQRLNRLLLLAPPNSTQRPQVRLTEVDLTSLDQHTAINSRRASAKPTFITTVDWLLPAVAQWCLELDSLHTTLIDPWLDHLDAYILVSQSCSAPITNLYAKSYQRVLPVDRFDIQNSGRYRTNDKDQDLKPVHLSLTKHES